MSATETIIADCSCCSGKLAISSFVSSASAATISAGNHTLLPNTANQSIDILVSGGGTVDGLNLYVATGDGGTDIGGTTAAAPKITGLDIIGVGTIFNLNNTGQQTPDQKSKFWSASTTDNPGSTPVVATGILAHLTLDTTGLTSGTYPLLIDFPDALGIDSDFGGVPATLQNGTLTIAALPEPATLALGLLAAPLVTRRRRRQAAQ